MIGREMRFYCHWNGVQQAKNPPHSEWLKSYRVKDVDGIQIAKRKPFPVKVFVSSTQRFLGWRIQCGLAAQTHQILLLSSSIIWKSTWGTLIPIPNKIYAARGWGQVCFASTSLVLGRFICVAHFIRWCLKFLSLLRWLINKIRFLPLKWLLTIQTSLKFWKFNWNRLQNRQDYWHEGTRIQITFIWQAKAEFVRDE